MFDLFDLFDVFNISKGSEAAAAPSWSAIPDSDVPQDEAWTINLNSYVSGSNPKTFTIATGALPAGITLNPNGTFSGTVTNNTGSGSVTYTATNAEGAANSGTHNWSNLENGNLSIPDFAIARNATVNFTGAETFDINIRSPYPSLTRPAPFAITFDALTDSVFPGISRPLHELSFWWDFGDTGATFQNIPVDHPFGNNANTAQGPFTGHVFEEGVYTVKCMVYDHVTGNVGYDEITVTATNTDAAFPTTQTIYLDPTATWANSPVGANQVTTWAAAQAAMNVAGDRRLVMDYGANITADIQFEIRQSGIKRIHAVGNPADGYVDITPTIGFPSGSVFYIRDPNVESETVMTDLSFIGDYDPLTGTGELHALKAIFVLDQPYAAAWRCKMRGLNGFFDGSSETGGIVYQDNDVADWKNFGVFGSLVDGVCRGNSLKQNPLAFSGDGGKAEPEYSVQGDGTTVLFTHGIDFLGATAQNLVVTKRNRSTGVVTVLEAGTDYSFTDTTVTYNVAPLATEDAYIYFARWADHGPIRTFKMVRGAIVHNDMASYAGWSTAGAPTNQGAIQPCIRNNSDTSANTTGIINSNRCEGGINVIATGPANGNAQVNDAQDCVIESNYVICDSHTWSPIAALATGTTVRNNVVRVPDFVESTIYRKVVSAVTYCGWANSPAGVNDRPVRIYNNTLLHLQSIANGADDIDGAVTLATDSGAVTPSDLEIGNTLIHYPEYTPPNPDYTPLDVNNYGELQTGSAAIDAGVSVPSIVWDDFFGNVRGVTNSIGAGDIAVAAPVAPVLSGTFDIVDAPAGTTVNYDVSALATGGDAPTGWALTGTPPTGLSISSAGLITGTLVEETLGANSYGVKATNAGGDSNILLDADGITVTSTSQELVLNGASYMTFGGIILATGDTIQLTYRASTQPNTGYAVSRGSLGSGSPPSVRATTFNRWYFADTVVSMDIDSVAQTSGAQVPANFDNTDKVMVLTVVGTSCGVGAFGAHYNLTQDFFEGVIKEISITSGGDTTTWAINSGSTTTESPTLDELGLGDMTFHNVDAGDWI